MSTGGIVLVALAILVGLVGIVVPILPGALLVLAAILVWAFIENDTTGWVTFAIAAVCIGTSTVIKYTWPVKRMRQAEVRTSSLIIGGVAGIVGFFVVPVLGLPIGFVAGIYLAELAARHDHRVAWASTVHALKGVALSIFVELTGALFATGAWVAAVVISA